VIFNEFHRGNQTSPWGEKGLGLGLAICDRMARLLGHRLGVRSRVGRGSVFSVDLPRAPAPAVPPRRDEARPQAIGIAEGLHVLCLDNDTTILDGMSTLLTQWGVGCDLASTPEAAMHALTARRPDLILADYHLDGDENGLDALVRLRAACDPAPPGALITADNSAELSAQVRQLGYVLLRKPVKPAALRALIAHLGRRIATPAGTV